MNLLKFGVIYFFVSWIVSSPSFAKGGETDKPVNSSSVVQFSVTDPAQKMSKDLLRKVLRYLEPRDLANLGSVNRSWNRAVNTPEQWRSILPTKSIQTEADLIANLLARGNFEVGQRMLAGRNDVQQIVQSALKVAVFHLRAERLEKLIEMGAILAGVRINYVSSGINIASTPLIWAIHKKNLNFFKKMIDLKVDVNEAGIVGSLVVYPLHQASGWCVEAVDLLLKAGARVDLVPQFMDGSQDSALMYAASIRSPESVQIIQKLIEAGASIHHRGDHGSSPLHKAAISGNLEGVRILLEAGADRHAENEEAQRWTPLELAVKFGNPETVKVFLKDLPLNEINRINPHFRFTLLHLAAINKSHSVEMIQTLVALGADVCLAYTVNKAPHELAAEEGNHEAARFLECLSRSRACSDQ